MKGITKPQIQEEVTFRTKEQMQLFDKRELRDTVPVLSDMVPCAPFRKFGLYLMVWGKNEPDTLHFEVEFLERWSGQWYTYKQGLFAALFYEDTDTATGIWECFVGDVLGRAMRVKLTGIGVSAANYFTVSIGTDFWN